MNRLQSIFKRDKIEDKLFLTAMLIAIPYFITSITFDLLSKNSGMLLWIDSSFFLVCIGMIFLSSKETFRNWLVNFFCLMVLSGVTFFWLSSGGLQGGGAYVFPVISVLIILITQRRVTFIFTILLAILAILLPSEIIPAFGTVDYVGLLFDFILNLIMLTFLLLSFKRALDKEYYKLEDQNLKIDRLNKDLRIKSTELELYNRDIKALQRNLEQQAEKKEETLKRENERIIEYAFINAHLVRAPLTNIIGFTDILSDKKAGMKELNKLANQLDQIVHKLGGVLNNADVE